ncbi:phosphotransferase [Alteromonas oceanisediminis]|uniref:phosphotransferase n=1 Tax=Alteromonas oceanisediminis TaxID=2836180 RepID=UPI001BDB46DB|nr:phosphotransferase [Alteromonas oceanisediminis]MBT0584845.1 phosphotransferase [Alteromonas oceanisediminis]
MLTIEQLPEGLLSKIDCEGPMSIRSVNESLINAVYCLKCSEQRYLVKRFFADQSTGRARKSLFAIQQKLAKVGIAPKPLYLCEKQGFYAEEWVPHNPVPLSVLPQAERIRALAAALAAIHSVKLTTTRLDLPSQWQQYIEAAKLSENHKLTRRAEELVFAASSSANAADDVVFCHNDLAFNHVIDYEQPMIIDWEYCASGNRYFDLASSMTINRLSQPQQMMLISDYADLTGIELSQVQNGVSRHEPLVTLTYQLWYAAITEHMKHA